MADQWEKNLLKETLDMMATNGKSPDDVEWVGTENGWCSWSHFAERAKDYNYHSGYDGGIEVNASLVIVGADWWMERHDYDGSEWWEFKTLPQRPEAERQIVRLDNDWVMGMWGENVSPFSEEEES